MTVLLKYRQRVLKREGKHRFEEKRKEREDKKKQEQALKGDEDYEAEAEDELDRLLDEQDKEQKRKNKKQREKDQKVDFRQKMSVLASTTIGQEDEELGFGPKTINHFITDGNVEEVQDEQNSDDEFEPEEKKRLRIKKAALLEEFQNENPDMVQSEDMDELDSDYEMK